MLSRFYDWLDLYCGEVGVTLWSVQIFMLGMITGALCVFALVAFGAD